MKDRLAHVVREAARALTRDLTARLATHGVSFGHWAFLRILWQSDNLTQRELSEQAGVMEPTTAAALKAMEELGYVERRQLPENRKNVYVHLTPKGRALRAKLEPMAVAVNKAAVRGVDPADVAACRRALLGILENLKGLKYIFVPLGSAGDVNPFIWLALLMAARGHEVVVVAHAGMAHAPARAGLRTVPVGSVADHDAIVGNPDLWNPDRAFNLLAATFADRAREEIPAIRAEVVPGRTVVVATGIALGARIVAEADRLPLVTVQLQPLVFMSEDDRPLMDARLGFAQHLPRWGWRAVFFLIHKAIDAKVAGPINALRAEMGLREPLRGMMRDWWMSPQCVLALFPDWFAPRRGDWPPQTVLTRFPLYDGDLAPDPAAERFLDAGPPPLLFTPGSANMWGKEFFAAAAAACLRLGMRGMFVTPFTEHLPSPLPTAIGHFARVPYSSVFPRCAAIVHHGGIGTCAQGFAAGVPQLVMPMAHDQPDNAQRLKRLGVGDYLLPKHFHADAVAARLTNLLASSEVARACAEMKARMAAQMPPERVADLLDILRPCSD